MIKIPGYRTKRRKIQRELALINDWIYDKPINELHVPDPNIFQEIVHFSSPELNYEENLLDFNIYGSLDQPSNFSSEHNVTDSSSDLHTELTSDFIQLKQTSTYNEHTYQENVLQSLREWAVKCSVPQNTVDKLLKILKYEANLTFLPKTCRTLLHTESTKLIGLRKINPNGIYYHFGLKKGIIHYSSSIPLPECIKIAVGVDGLPISKSSSGQFWPILAYIMPFHKYVFPIGIYYGNEKPKDSNDYLKDFISEVIDLTSNGITIKNEKIKVLIEVMCCDAPAKSFLLRVKGHSGFSSCTRCTHEGEFLNNRVCFPFVENGNNERTHEDYLTMKNEEHHISSTISCLALIPSVNIVKLFSLDYMHLVCLGVMKKLINLWLHKGPVSVRLHSQKSKLISVALLKVKKCITNDFARKPRGIDEVNRFKATEFRQLLLYTGPLVFKDILSHECYQHFLVLSISMRILLSLDHAKYSDYAHQLLKYFVKTFQQIYGCHFLSHNVHGLLHLIEDYTRYGPLDNCSTFPFENYMKELKKMLRKNEKPLEQVVKRFKEQQSFNEKIELDNDQFSLTLKEPDCFILTNDDSIVKITEFLPDSVTFVGQTFINKEDMFIKPLKSSKINIFIVKNLSVETNQFKISDIKKKMIIFDLDNKLTAIPIIS